MAGIWLVTAEAERCLQSPSSDPLLIRKRNIGLPLRLGAKVVLDRMVSQHIEFRRESYPPGKQVKRQLSLKFGSREQKWQ